MGPIALFDKSFLQSLSVDESVWFDHFFTSNICPLFYVETLADLEKSVRAGRTPEREVGLIAEKFPEMGSHPNVFHTHLCVGDLLGQSVPMTRQILVAGGRPVLSHMGPAVVHEVSPEADAFSRWQQADFLAVERLYARQWRYELGAMNLAQGKQIPPRFGISVKSCRSLADAKQQAERVVHLKGMPVERMVAALVLLGVPEKLRIPIIGRWTQAGCPTLADYAPYAAFVLTIDLFFWIALAKGLISQTRPSNRVDIAYLYYLPFCQVFVSSDNLHQRCVPLFLGDGQRFVYGPTLKADLTRLNKHYAQLPEETRRGGVMSFARTPPRQDISLVADLWDLYWPGWREEGDVTEASSGPTMTVAELDAVVGAPSASLGFETSDPQTLVMQNLVRKQKGSWWQLPHDLPMDE